MHSPILSRHAAGVGLCAVGLALALLTFVAGDLAVPRSLRVSVETDASPATRGAFWHDAAAFDAWAATLPGTRVSPADAELRLRLTSGRPDCVPDPGRWFVLDPALDRPRDVRALRLEDDGRVAVAATSDGVQRLPRGDHVRLDADGNDSWPENDVLDLGPPPRDPDERVWISERPAPDGWSTRTDVLDGAAVVVLDGVSAARIGTDLHTRVVRYARDGGTLVLGGGPGGFGAGGWGNTDLDRISPLASLPPRPRHRYVLLVDASGSMNRPAGHGTHFDAAAAGVRAAAAALPPDARLDVGGFAADLTWWTRDARADDVIGLTLPPTRSTPRGPTNLAPILHAFAENDGPLDVLVLGDGDAPIPDAPRLVARLRDAGVRVNLVTADTAVDPGLAAVIDATGGTLTRVDDVADWARPAADAARTALGPLYDPTITAVGRLQVEGLNRTWPREHADGFDGPHTAVWPVGLGRVVALGFRPGPDTLAALALRVRTSAPPRNVAVAWEDGPTLRVRVVADARHVRIHRDGSAYDARRVGPDTFMIEIAGTRRPAVAAAEVDGGVVARRATAGRYPPAFEHVGNDARYLRDFGRVTYADDLPALPRAIRLVDAGPALLAAAAGLVLTGLWTQRRTG